MTIYLKIAYDEDTGEESLAGKSKIVEGVIPARNIRNLPNDRKAWRPLVEPVPDRDKERYKLYVRTASDPVIEADRVVKTFIYTPSSKYLERMQALLEQRTDTKREREVMIKQARAALKIQTLPKKGDFPMLDAEVGVTINGNTGQPVTDPVEAAQMILAEEDQTDEDLAAEREFRLSVLKQINEAATDAEKIQIFEDNIG